MVAAGISADLWVLIFETELIVTVRTVGHAPCVRKSRAGERIVKITQVATVTVARLSFISALIMALHTIERAMHAAEREKRHRVLEEADFPELLAMALLAIRQSSAVDVILRVTSQAVLAEAREFAAVFVTLDAIQ